MVFRSKFASTRRCTAEWRSVCDPGRGTSTPAFKQVVAGPRRHRGGPDRLAGSRGPEEQVAIGRRGTSVLEIVQDGLADHGGERKRRGVAGFALGYRQPLTLPVDVVEGERGDFPAAQPADAANRHCPALLTETAHPERSPE